MSELSIIAIPLAIAAVVLLLGFVGCNQFYDLEPTTLIPDVFTTDATDISSHGATLNGRVSPAGDAKYQFEYDTTQAYQTTQALGMTTAPMPVPATLATPAPISDLTPGTSYDFVLTATAGGIVFRGDQLSFMTLQPLGFWPLDEDAGPTAVDHSTNQLNGTFYGGVAYAVPDLQAAGGGTGPVKAARFDGTGDMRVEYNAALNPPSFRIDVLAMASAAPAPGAYSAVMSTLDGTNFTGYAIYAGPTGYWELFLGDGSMPSSLQSGFITSNAPVMPNQIVAISASYDAIKLEATLTVTPDALTATPGSGQSRTTPTIAYVPNQLRRLRIASDYTGGNFFSGALANVYVFPS